MQICVCDEEEGVIAPFKIGSIKKRALRARFAAAAVIFVFKYEHIRGYQSTLHVLEKGDNNNALHLIKC